MKNKESRFVNHRCSRSQKGYIFITTMISPSSSKKLDILKEFGLAKWLIVDKGIAVVYNKFLEASKRNEQEYREARGLTEIGVENG